MKIWKRTVRILAAAGLFMMLCVSLSVLYVQQKYGEERLLDFPYAILLVTSGSMEPKMQAGDGILVTETPYEELKPGDIITFEVAGELVTHQIMRWEDTGVITRGLANELEDSPVQKEQYRARTVFVIPHLSSLLAWSDKTLGKIMIAGILFMLLFGWDIMNAVYDYFEKRRMSI